MAWAKKAIDLGYGVFYSQMAGRARDKGLKEEEKEWFEKGLEFNEKDVFYQLRYGMYLKDEGRDDLALIRYQKAFDNMNRPFSVDWDNKTMTEEAFSSPYDEVTTDLVKAQLLTFLIVTLHSTNDASYDDIIIRLDELAFQEKYDDDQLYKYAIITYNTRAPIADLMPLLNRYLGRMAASGRADEARVRFTLITVY